MHHKYLFIKIYIFVFLVAIIFMWTLVVPRLPESQRQAAFTESIELRDWHDYKTMALDANRFGLGEFGEAGFIRNKMLKKLEKRMSLDNGFNALLSDKISVNRSLPDIRHEGCRTKQYPAKLPNVSIIIPFYNEHLSVLKRTLHSLVNRSPPELLEEILLVDDASSSEQLFEPLNRYVAKYFPKLKIIRLVNRTGLIGARLVGARLAKAEVLIFLDSHIEANYNWLPPLLEPIANDKRTAVCPFIDVIDDKTFEYTSQDDGARGAFNWVFDYKRLPLLAESLIDRTRPFQNPVMAGGLFGIWADFFWELGGYDEGLDIWGGEQYELSFKIWMCGGCLLDVPCSRVGHIYRGERKMPPNSREAGDYIRRNYKRVAEVWMDEYKEYLYAHDDSYKSTETGNLTSQKDLRNKLKCKSFKWYMENIAFDLVTFFPPIEPPDYANGIIQSLAYPKLCVDTLNREPHSLVGLFTCSENKTKPQHNQNWALSAHRDLRIRPELSCLRVKKSKPKAQVWLWECQEEGGDQFWYYDPQKQWIVFERNGKLCLEAMIDTRSLRVNSCRNGNLRMKWNFGFVNLTALKNFFVDIPDISYRL